MDNLDFSSMVPQPSATQLRMGGRAKRRRCADLKWWFSKSRTIPNRPLSGMFANPTKAAAKSILIIAHYNSGLGIKLIADKLFGTRTAILGIRQVLIGAGIYGRNAHIRRGPIDRLPNYGSTANEIQEHGRLERKHDRWWTSANMNRLTPMEVYYANHEARKAYGAKIAKARYYATKDDPLMIIIRSMRSATNRIKRRYGGVKRKPSIQYLGCTQEHARTHIQAQFKAGMTWANHGQWHIDHIRPLASFNLLDPEHVEQACHYTNLQPLWAKDNIAKSDQWSAA